MQRLAKTEKPEKNICVYCGSGAGHNPKFVEAARTLGAAMAQADIGLVYGGGSLGLMGEIARSVLRENGYVTGIIPEFLCNREKMLRDVQDLIVTRSMHERKQIMFEKSDAFVALPGGVGTLEELVEQLTWSQLGQHAKPVVLGDIDGFWEPLLTLVDHMRSEAFVRPGLEVSMTQVTRVEDIIPVVMELTASAEKLGAEQSIPEKF